MSLHHAYLDALALVNKPKRGLETGLSGIVRKRDGKFHSQYRHKAKFATSNGHKGDFKGFPGLPIWASALIIVAIVLVGLFLITFGVSTYFEWRRSKDRNKSMRWKKILWTSLKVALFLWIPIGIYNLLTKCFRRNKKRSGSGSGGGGGFRSSFASGSSSIIKSEKLGGRYAEIEEDEQRLNNADDHHHSSSSSNNNAEAPGSGDMTGATRPWRMSQHSNADDSRYEPMSYKPNVYNPYAAYAGAEPLSRGRSPSDVGGAASIGPVVNVSPPDVGGGGGEASGSGNGMHQPPPPRESGDLGSRTPSPNRGGNFVEGSGSMPGYYG